MDGEILQHLPKSFQLWQQIEVEAEKRAKKRFQEIIKGKAASSNPQREDIEHSSNGGSSSNELSYKFK